MKIQLYILSILVLPLLALSQAVEIDGKLKVSQMDNVSTENHLVVKQADGTLATRMLSSLPPPIDTLRNLASDLELAKILCECGSSMPPFLVESTLAAGYSVADLLGSGVPVTDLLNGNASVAELIAAGALVQDLLAANQTPLLLFNLGIVIDSLYGKTYQGGLIFYFNSATGNGLVSASMDQSAGRAWGCSGTAINGADGTAIGTGSQNTIDIEAGCNTTNTPADICANLVLNGFDDWFMPSKDELNEMYLKIGQGAPAPNTNIGNFAIGYKSSSEIGAAKAWEQLFFNGLQFSGDKNTIIDDSGVRAIRAF